MERVKVTYAGKDYTEVTEVYVGTSWIKNSQTISSFDAAGNNTRIEQESVEGIMVNTTKYLEFVDSKGEYAGYSDYKWENNTWVLQYSYTSANTYNANGALEQVVNETASSFGSSKSKIVYSDFIAITTGVSQRSAADILSVFPIPAKDFITISPLGNESLTFKILNGQGIEIPTDFSSSKIDVSQWTTGVYLLHIRTAEGNNYTKKLIKE